MSEPKASINDILDEGFRAAQFGGAANFDEVGGMLDGVRHDAGRWVEQALGAVVYAALADGTYACDCARLAEIQYSAAVLYRKRIGFVESSATAGLQDGARIDVMRTLRQQADDAMQTARYYLGEAAAAAGVTIDVPGSTLRSGIVETGPFPLTSGAPA